MSRATLKLPAKSAAASDSWSPPRKPLRGGIKGKKASASSLRNPPAARQPLPVGERSAGGQGPRPARAEIPAPAAAARPADAPRDISRPRPDRGAAPADTAPAKKIYPKRGIARSTGARALPPPRVERPATADAGTGLPAPSAMAAPASVAPAAPGPFQARHTPRAPAAPHADAGPRRVLAEPPRLAKRVAEMALCSRRQADEWIENGWVRVDGVVVTTLGVRVHAKARIEITDAAKTHESVAVTIIYNRPPAAPAASPDEADPLPKSLIRADNRWSEDETRVAFQATQLRGLAPAGKLDAEANGMLVLTQEGSVARRITGDATRLEKEYIVRVDGTLDADGLARLSYGLELDGIKLKRAQVSWQNEQQLRFVLHETRKHQIARMCELVGLRVVSIKRIRIGSVSLGKLPAGQWRYLRDNERF